MKSTLSSKLIILALTALLAGSAFAGTAHKGSLQLSDPVQVNGKQLPAGDYTVTWNDEGPNVNLNIARSGKVMATVSAKIVPLEQKSAQDAAEVKTSSTGARDLTAIRFSGKKYQLELGRDSGQSADKPGDSVK
jgi:hypothetical protein